MPREIVPVGTNQHDDETHPAFALIGASRVTSAGGKWGGQVLFDSEVAHNHFVVLRVETATRKRDLSRDWIHGGRQIIEVGMSEAQWASMISSMNTSGVPCTLMWTREDGQIPGLDLDSRLEKTHQEVKGATQKGLEDVQAAFELVKEKPTKANLRHLEIVMGNLPANLEFVAKSLTEHAENVVARSRADVEAFVINKARQVGLDPTSWEPVDELEPMGDKPKELEA